MTLINFNSLKNYFFKKLYFELQSLLINTIETKGI